MSADRPPQLPRPGRRLLRLVLAVLVGLVAIEGLVRARQLLRHGTTNETVLARDVDEVTGRTIPLPGSAVAGIRICSRGFRGDEIDVPKPAGRVRIAFLGASTTFCAEATSNETTWPHLVVTTLRERYPGIEFDLVNAAVPGYMSRHSLERFEVRVAALEPDVVIVYHGTNDLGYDSRLAAEAEGLELPSQDGPTGLARWSLAYNLVHKTLQVRDRLRRSRGVAGRLSADVEALSLDFEVRLDELVRAARAVAPVVAVATFSKKVRRGQSPGEQLGNCNTSLFYMPYMTVETLLDGFDAYNGVVRRVARSQGAVLIENEDSIPGDAEHFADSVHLTDVGCEAMAARVVRGLVESDAFRTVLDATEPAAK